MDRIRAFLAVDPSPEIHRRLVEVKSLLAETGAAVRWVRDEGLHVTVKFLGPVTRDGLEALCEELQYIRSTFRAFRVCIKNLGVFPDPRRPRVVWAAVESADLPRLARAVEEAAARAGFGTEQRPFRPHITLGRVKDTRGWPRLREVLAARRAIEVGTCEVTELVAYRSDLRPSGAVYTKLWTIPFDNPTQGEGHGT